MAKNSNNETAQPSPATADAKNFTDALDAFRNGFGEPEAQKLREATKKLIGGK